MPTINISKLKDSMVRSNNLLQNDIPVVLDATTVEGINCYAYALGIMYDDDTKRRGFYRPGFTEGIRYDGENVKELMKKIRIDLQNLGISFRQFDLNSKKMVLRDKEYLIKVFYTPKNKKLPAGDFHFVRKDKQTGKWFHKMGWYKQPDVVQSDPGYEGPIPGSEPTTFTLNDDDGFTYVYNPVAYLAITED